jgi:hypothetical protein
MTDKTTMAICYETKGGADVHAVHPGAHIVPFVEILINGAHMLAPDERKTVADILRATADDFEDLFTHYVQQRNQAHVTRAKVNEIVSLLDGLTLEEQERVLCAAGERLGAGPPFINISFPNGGPGEPVRAKVSEAKST